MVALRVNGQEKNFDGDPSMPVLWYLRDILGMTWNQVWMWRGIMRRLHGSCRRRGGSRVPNAGVRHQWEIDHHD
jgi:hypothetical protein